MTSPPSPSTCCCATATIAAAPSTRSCWAIEGAMTLHAAPLRALPSVDEVLKAGAAIVAIARHGRPAVVAAVRQALDATRAALRAGGTAGAQRGARGIERHA